MLLRNLLDNALRYSPPGARIRVAVARGAEGVLLTVEDSGPGMTPEQIARLGERFFRVLGNERSGSGLGWSIVQRVVQALHAQVTVSRSPALGGLRVTVRCPV
jgi:two-component system sensor histidine kinase QseC